MTINSASADLEGGLGEFTGLSSSVDAVVDWFGPTDFLIIHGDQDPLVPRCQSEKLYEALQVAGVPSRYVLIPGAKHGAGVFEEEYYRMMTRFFLDISGK